MKALRCFSMPVVFISSVVCKVYAGTPAYLRAPAYTAMENGLYSFFKTIYYLIMFALILAAAYYATKFLAKKGMAQSKSKTMKLMESMPLGADKSIHLVKVGAQYFLLGSASKNMFMISEIDKDKLFEEQPDGAMNVEGYEYEAYENAFEAKDFSTTLNSMKTNLNKLKSMVRGNNRDEV